MMLLEGSRETEYQECSSITNHRSISCNRSPVNLDASGEFCVDREVKSIQNIPLEATQPKRRRNQARWKETIETAPRKETNKTANEKLQEEKGSSSLNSRGRIHRAFNRCLERCHPPFHWIHREYQRFTMLLLAQLPQQQLLLPGREG